MKIVRVKHPRCKPVLLTYDYPRDRKQNIINKEAGKKILINGKPDEYKTRLFELRDFTLARLSELTVAKIKGDYQEINCNFEDDIDKGIDLEIVYMQQRLAGSDRIKLVLITNARRSLDSTSDSDAPQYSVKINWARDSGLFQLRKRVDFPATKTGFHKAMLTFMEYLDIYHTVPAPVPAKKGKKA